MIFPIKSNIFRIFLEYFQKSRVILRLTDTKATKIYDWIEDVINFKKDPILIGLKKEI